MNTIPIRGYFSVEESTLHGHWGITDNALNGTWDITDNELRGKFQCSYKRGKKYPVYLGQGYLGDRLDNNML